MANVHRIGDYEQNNNNYQNFQGQGGGGNQQMMQLIGGISGDPRGENFWDMLKNSFCPKLKLVSFTTVICGLLTILYFSMLVSGGIDKTNGYFLSVDFYTLCNFGGNSPFDVKNNYQIFRWITSTLLIPDFYFIVIALFMIIICYSILEASHGYQTAMIIYFGGGISGAIFGNLCNMQNVIPYSETFSSIYACIGCLIGCIIIYWQKLDGLGDMKCLIVCFAALIIIFVLMFTLGSKQTLYYDSLGQLGGFLAGMFLAMIFIQVPQRGDYEKICQKLGIGFLAVQVGLSIILLFALHD